MRPDSAWAEARGLRRPRSHGDAPRIEEGALVEKLATLELTVGMALEDDAYRAAVVAAVVAHIEATKE